MPGHDYCAVFGCSNARYMKDKLIKKSHVGILRWHHPNEKDRKSWEKQINRENFKVTSSTAVCSNHFAAGYYNRDCSTPTLFMKGYDTEAESSSAKRRKEPAERMSINVVKTTRHIQRDGFEDLNNDVLVQTPPPFADHDYDDNESCARCRVKYFCVPCTNNIKKIQELMKVIESQQQKIEILKQEISERKPFRIEDIKGNDKLVNLYTGLQSYDVFEWLYKRIENKVNTLSYSRDKEATGKKRGPKRYLSGREEMFMTLIRLRLGLVEGDLAFRFNVSQSTVSAITSTWCSFLSREWSIFIHWPTRDENKQFMPKCFEKWPNTIAILDCTEGGIEKPSLAKAQVQTYSSYKSKNTWKKLISITPGGVVSFISKAYGGSASDRFIVEDSGILSLVKQSDVVMVDKGFNISDLLVCKQAELVCPPFLKDKTKFSTNNVRKTSDIAKARIHVERAIARIKDFRIVQGNIPLTMKDQIDDIFIIIAAINNIGPCLVPL